MALLHPLRDLALSGQSILDEVMTLDGSAGALRVWLDERCSFLGLPLLSEGIIEVIISALAHPPCARPTADDLLDFPVFAPYADPLQVLPISSRPCVVMAHVVTQTLATVPRRCLLAMPWLHQIFSEEGGERAKCEGRYRWCGHDFDLWWLEARSLAIGDVTNLNECSQEVPEILEAVSTDLPPLAFNSARTLVARSKPDDAEHVVAALVASALKHRAEGRFAAAEVCYRAALEGVGNDEDSSVDLWAALAGTMMERGNLSGARQACLKAQRFLPQGFVHSVRGFDGYPLSKANEESESSSRRSLGGAEASSTRLWGLCEFILAVDKFRELAMEQSSTGEVASERYGGLRAMHVQFYYRSAIAAEANSWEVFAGLGEFYRLVGCPSPPFQAPAPDASTALSYFEQSGSIEPGSHFVQERLSELRGG